MRAGLYRVIVEPTDGSAPIAVSPAMIKDAAQKYLDVIKAQIRAGREKRWSNPHLYVVKPEPIGVH